jgi:chromatin remodeling complex protein RSC6
MPAKKNSTIQPKTSAKKASNKVQESPPPPTPVEPESVETPVESVEQNGSSIMNYYDDFVGIQADLKSALTVIKSLATRVNQLEKSVNKDRKLVEKKMKGRAKRVHDPNKPPSGFAKPGPISDELRKFLGIGKDELIARTAVTQHINKYCKAHNLQKESDKRHILPDPAMKKLLRLKPGDELTFFNLQKYIKIHYPNKDGEYIH